MDVGKFVVHDISVAVPVGIQLRCIIYFEGNPRPCPGFTFVICWVSIPDKYI